MKADNKLLVGSGDHPDDAIDVDDFPDQEEDLITPELQAKINEKTKQMTGKNESFLDLVLKDKASVIQARDQLQKAVRMFETQFSSGQMEAVVFNDFNAVSSAEVSETANEAIDDKQAIKGQNNGNKLQNPAYPASHPANASLQVQDFLNSGQARTKNKKQHNPFDKMNTTL